MLCPGTDSVRRLVPSAREQDAPRRRSRRAVRRNVLLASEDLSHALSARRDLPSLAVPLPLGIDRADVGDGGPAVGANHSISPPHSPHVSFTSWCSAQRSISSRCRSPLSASRA